jgi:hypothetical protein
MFGSEAKLTWAKQARFPSWCIMPIEEVNKPLLRNREAKDQARLQALQHIAREAFAALDRGERTTHTRESLDLYFDNLDRITGRR